MFEISIILFVYIMGYIGGFFHNKTKRLTEDIDKIKKEIKCQK